ncbi:hypothetical protein J6590_035391 [Homalodisca vitripennis]|nr:hypothetical protein J6590_035391 [Homalodisca vitripennis]
MRFFLFVQLNFLPCKYQLKYAVRVVRQQPSRSPWLYLLAFSDFNLLIRPHCVSAGQQHADILRRARLLNDFGGLVTHFDNVVTTVLLECLTYHCVSADQQHADILRRARLLNDFGGLVTHFDNVVTTVLPEHNRV